MKSFEQELKELEEMDEEACRLEEEEDKQLHEELFLLAQKYVLRPNSGC